MSSWSNNTAPEQVDQFLSSPIKENWPFRPQELFLNPLNAHRLKPNAKGPKSPSYVVLGGSLAIFTLASNLSWEEKITQQKFKAILTSELKKTAKSRFYLFCKIWPFFSTTLTNRTFDQLEIIPTPRLISFIFYQSDIRSVWHSVNQGSTLGFSRLDSTYRFIIDEKVNLCRWEGSLWSAENINNFVRWVFVSQTVNLRLRFRSNWKKGEKKKH